MPLAITMMLLTLAAVEPGRADPVACGNSSHAVPPPLSAWTDSAADQVEGEQLAIGAAATIRLRPTAEVQWRQIPERQPAPATHGGVVPFAVAAPGLYQVAISDASWVDVAGDRGLVASTSHGHGPPCSGIRKIVRFRLAPGAYTLQVSNSHNENVRVLITSD